MEKYNRFIGLYPVQKTLKMGLIPVGNTLKNIHENNVLDRDEDLFSNYLTVKGLMDKYHKNMIEKTLTSLVLDEKLLKEYAELSTDDKENRVRIQKIQDALRNAISKTFSSIDEFPLIWKKDMITVLLPNFITDDKDKEAVASFANHTSYFVDYNTIRKNLYEAKALKGSVAYRIVHENFPVFVENKNIFKKIMEENKYSELKDEINSLYHDFEEYMNVWNLEEFFHISNFTHVLSQSQIDVYNLVLGGKNREDGTKIKGINELIQIFNSKNEAEDRLPFFSKLKKMILSDKKTLSWIVPKFEDDNSLLNAVADCYEEMCSVFEGENNDGLINLMQSIKSFDLKGIFVKRQNINKLSSAAYGNWKFIQDALVDVERKKVRRTPRMTDETFESKTMALYDCQENFSLQQILEAVAALGEDKGEILLKWMDRKNTENEGGLFVKTKVMRRKAGWILDVVYPDNKSLITDKKAISDIKDLLDSLKDIKNYVQLFIPGGKEVNKDVNFYNRLMADYEKLSETVTLYNMVRNYLTRKPYSEKKMKLNFNYSNLMGGWDAEKLTENGSFLLRKENDVFLVIAKKGCKIALDKMSEDNAGDNYERIYYKQVTGAFRMLPKVFFSKKWMNSGECKPDAELIDGYAKGKHLKGKDFDLSFCHRLIDYFKNCCMSYATWSCYNLKFSETSSYEDISQFYNELEKQTYSISFQKIACESIDELVEAGSVYMFKIYNRDLSEHSKGRKQLQTLYYQMLFDKRNLENLVIKLNGGAAMYYRKASLHPEKPTHPAGVPMTNKNPLSENREVVYKYPLIKDYRYTRDTFHFHFPVTINCNSQGENNINKLANTYIRETEDLHIIGINRGERNLIYITVIDMQGNIVEQKSLNIIASDNDRITRRTDYNELLTRRENERSMARESWMTVKNIADMKEGYLSVALHHIVELLYKYNAVIAMEDLDVKFKNGRKHIEKEIYQKFEDMLVNKLNYLTDKKKEVDEIGGILRGLQLTAKAEDMNGYGRQNGILFRVPAWYIGMTCPVTGFINLLKPKYKNVQNARQFFEKIGNISYNSKDGWLEFELDYSQFTDKMKGCKEKWTICSAGQRSFKGQVYNLTKEYFELFNRFGIDVYGNLKEKILEQNSKEFFERMMLLFSLTVQMKNVDENGMDFLVSPVKDKNGKIFMSRNRNANLPLCGDANDAYNIARKCMLFIQQIRKSEEPFVKLSLTNTEWMNAVQ